jgi:pyrophosphatase PpaX
MIKAVLFDMDGVLVDSIGAWFKLFNKTLKHFGKEEMTMNGFLDKVWGGPIEKDAEEFFGKSIDEIKKFYFDNFKKNLKLFPHARETLKELRNKGLKLGLVTNTPIKQTYKLLEDLKLREYFDVVVGGDEVRNGKPAPDIILEACKRLKIEPKDALMIGDTPMDMMSCKNAGCFFVGFKTDGDERIDDLNELESKIFK